MSGQQINVNIRSLAVGGAGVGEVVSQADGGKELLGITAFVPFTTVGEKVLARVVEKKERYLRADLINVDESSSDRVEAPCPYYQNCGGCELQHVAYETQAKLKKEMLGSALRAAGLSTSVSDALHDVVQGEPYAYRRRISLHLLFA